MIFRKRVVFRLPFFKIRTRFFRVFAKFYSIFFTFTTKQRDDFYDARLTSKCWYFWKSEIYSIHLSWTALFIVVKKDFVYILLHIYILFTSRAAHNLIHNKPEINCEFYFWSFEVPCFYPSSFADAAEIHRQKKLLNRSDQIIFGNLFKTSCGSKEYQKLCYHIKENTYTF